MNIEICDGVQHLAISDELLPVLINNAAGFIKDQPIMVVFSAAVKERKGTEPPYFSGLGISSQLGLPLLAFSDPTLSWSPDVSIAWYAGNEKVPNLPCLIANIIDEVAKKTGCKPILVGGSCGGFAALNIACRCKCNPRVLVWNPQTRISQYQKSFVETYLAVAFPSMYRPSNTLYWFETFIKNIGMSDAAFGHHCSRATIYLQNRSDWHFAKHLAPIFDTVATKQLGGSSFVAPDIKTFFFLGDWGDGHVAPPYEMLKSVITCMVNDQDPQDVLTMLEDSFGFGYLPLFSLDHQSVLSIKPIVTKVENEIFVRIDFVDSKRYDKIYYACYFLSEGVPISKQFYTEDSEFSYASTVSDIDEVICFVRDSFNRTHRMNVKLLHSNEKE